MTRAAANGTLEKIREVRLQNPHPASLVVSDDMGRQFALLALIDQNSVRRRKTVGHVDPVDVALALVPEEEGAAVVGTQENKLPRFASQILDATLVLSAPQVLSSDGEQVLAAEVADDQAASTIRSVDQGDVEDVLTSAIGQYCSGQNNAVSVIGGHIVDEDSSVGSVGYVDKGATVVAVVGDHVLQTRRRGYQRAQIDRFHELQ